MCLYYYKNDHKYIGMNTDILTIIIPFLNERVEVETR